MKTLIGALLAVTALSPTLASAQGPRPGADAQIGRDDDRGPRDGWQARGPGPGRGDRPDPADARPQPDRADRGVGFAGVGGPRPTPGPDDGRGDDRWGDRGERHDDGRGPPRGAPRPDPRDVAGRDGRDWRQDRGPRDRGRWNHGWRGDDRGEWNGDRSAYRGGYRRYAIGAGLGSSFWSRNRWIENPYAYRLRPAHGPYRWVRYDGDALLVDQRSGRVVDAAYGIF